MTDKLKAALKSEHFFLLYKESTHHSGLERHVQAKVYLKLNLNWATASLSLQQNDVKSNTEHDDSSTQSKNTVITCATAEECLFAL